MKETSSADFVNVTESANLLIYGWGDNIGRSE